MGLDPYGPGPIWAWPHMGLGPNGPGPIWAWAQNGPGPIWAWAHMGLGPYVPGSLFAGPYKDGPYEPHQEFYEMVDDLREFV